MGSSMLTVSRLQKAMLALAGLNLALIGYGLILFPQALTASSDGPKGLVASFIILTCYALVGWFGSGPSFRASPVAFRWGVRAGLLIALNFGVFILLEYILQPEGGANALLGFLQFGGMMFVFMFLGVAVTLASGRVRYGTLAAIWSALVGSLSWFSLVMLVYFAFLGTARQEHVLRIENQEDFVRSGMDDFRAFVMQDFMGACFFHLLLSPVIAAILGSLGGAMAAGFLGVRRRLSPRSRGSASAGSSSQKS